MLIIDTLIQEARAHVNNLKGVTGKIKNARACCDNAQISAALILNLPAAVAHAGLHFNPLSSPSSHLLAPSV